MEKLKKVAWIGALGGLFGGISTSWLAPRVISWYFAPPAQVEFSCRGPIDWALGKLQLAQIWGVAVGMLLALIVAFMWSRHSRKQKLAESVS